MAMSLTTVALGFAVMGLFDVSGPLKEPRRPDEPKHPHEPEHSLGTNGLGDALVGPFILIRVLLPTDD